MMTVLTEHHYLNMPWKNQLGSTLQLACSHDSLDAFDWRISVAAVNQDGPFSLFPNKHRMISVLDGNGIILKNNTLINIDPTTQKNHSLYLNDIFSFSGDDDIYSELINGQIRDFNLIYNPDRYQAKMVLVTQNHILKNITDADLVFIFNPQQTALKLAINAEKFTLNHFQMLKIEDLHDIQIQIDSIVEPLCYVIELREIEAL